MKHPYITHLPHPNSRNWGLVTLIVYSMTFLAIVLTIAIAWLILR
jgi:hypothetical protein